MESLLLILSLSLKLTNSVVTFFNSCYLKREKESWPCPFSHYSKVPNKRVTFFISFGKFFQTTWPY
jgi:hypothetical protein